MMYVIGSGTGALVLFCRVVVYKALECPVTLCSFLCLECPPRCAALPVLPWVPSQGVFPCLIEATPTCCCIYFC